MSDTSEQVRAELDATTALPFGIARSAAVEALVQRADELSDERLSVLARLRLMTAYCYGGEPLRRFPVFSWLLDRYDHDRTLFDQDDEYRLLWMFKWVTVGAVEHPAVALDRIMAGLEDMSARFAAAGEALAPVLSCRFQVLARVRGHDAAEQAYAEWTEAPRSPLSDCQTCEPALRVWHLAALGRDAEALGHAFPVLDHGGCADQPQRMIGHCLEPMLRLGMADRAGREHLRGVRLLRERPGSTSTWAQHVLLCARTGRLHRGLDLLEHRLHEVDDAPAPEDAMWLAAAGARLLRGLEDAGEGDLPVRELAIADGGLQEHGATELRTRLARRALELADRFDRRNGTAAVGAEVTGWLDAPPLPDLPIDRVLTRPRGRQPRAPDPTGAWLARPHAAVPGPGREPSAGPDTATGTATGTRTGTANGTANGGGRPARPGAAGAFTAVGDHTGPIDIRLVGADAGTVALALVQADQAGDPRQRRCVLEHWAAVRELVRAEPGADDATVLAMARLDVALALDRAEQGALAPQAAREVALALNDAGDPGPALWHALSCLRLELVAGAAIEPVLADAQALADEGDRVAPAGDRARLQLALAALLRAVAGRAEPQLAAHCLARAGQAVERGLAAAATVPDGQLDPGQRAAVALLHRDRAMTLAGRDRVAALEQAVRLLPPGVRPRERALVGHDLGVALAGSGARDQACHVLAMAADDALAASDEELAVHTQHALGRALAEARDAAGAVQALSRAVELCGPHGGALLLAELRQGLAAALRDSGQVIEAAELADGALDELEDALEAWRIEPPLEHEGSDEGSAAGPDLQACRVAADLAFTAAQCAQDLGETDLAADLARRAATWAHGQGEAEAEAMLVAAQCTRHPPEAADLYARAARMFTGIGRWWDAAGCRRARALSVFDQRGLEDALAALDQAQVELSDVDPPPRQEVRLAWERLALTEQRGRILAGAGRFEEAVLVVQGLDDAFRRLGDATTAREVVGLRARMLDELGRTAEALPELGAAAEEALADGQARQAGRLGGYLSAFLDELGRPDEAADIWRRFAPTDGPVASDPIPSGPIPSGPQPSGPIPSGPVPVGPGDGSARRSGR